MARRITESPWLFFALAGLLLALAISTQIEIRPPARPEGSASDLLSLRDRKNLNLIFVLVDTLRADHLGAYGYARDTSPNFDLLAEQGVLFERVVSSSSWTKTSMASLWTATHPINHGILQYDQVMPDEALLPAEILKGAGVRTAGIWRNGWIAPNFGFGQGFDSYVNPKPGLERVELQRGNPSTRVLLGTDEDLVTAAREFFDAYGHERFFLYLHLMDVHQYVYDSQSTKFGTSYMDAYDQSILWTDKLLAVLFGALVDRALLDRTLVVITADHGEAFLEHGKEGHARNLYAEVAQVPLLLVPPFGISGGLRIREEVSNVDLWPTLLDLLGMPGLPNADGRSLVPLIARAAGVPAADPAAADALAARPIFSQLDRGWGQVGEKTRPLIAVQRGSRKLIHHADNPARSELYDRASDPGEKQNLFAAASPERDALVALVDQHLRESKRPFGVEPPKRELSELQRNQLKALGYLGDE
jgi:arylsulfatase A-like enzyme